MATIYVPIRIMSLQMASNPGNAYWKKITMASSGYEYQVPVMKPDVDSHIYGKLLIPNNIKGIANGGMNPQIRPRYITSSTTGNFRLQISWGAYDSGANINDAGFNAETLQTPGISGVGARVIQQQEFALSTGPANGAEPDTLSAELFVDFYRNGANAGDTVTNDLELLDLYYVCDV